MEAVPRASRAPPEKSMTPGKMKNTPKRSARHRALVWSKSGFDFGRGGVCYSFIGFAYFISYTIGGP